MSAGLFEEIAAGAAAEARSGPPRCDLQPSVSRCRLRSSSPTRVCARSRDDLRGLPPALRSLPRLFAPPDDDVALASRRRAAGTRAGPDRRRQAPSQRSPTSPRSSRSARRRAPTAGDGDGAAWAATSAAARARRPRRRARRPSHASRSGPLERSPSGVRRPRWTRRSLRIDRGCIRAIECTLGGVR